MNKLARALMAVVLLGGSVAAQASLLYGTPFTTGTTNLFSVNQSTGALTSIGDTGIVTVGDLTSDTRPGSFTLWGVELVDNRLYRFDAATGAVIGSVAIAGTQASITSIAFDPVTGVLYGNTTVGFGATFDELYSINPGTGVATSVGRILFDNVFALAFSQTGQLFGIADATDQLISIDTSTGNGTLVANLALSLAFDMASRPEDNVMFVADSGTFSLYELNTTTGAATLVGPYGSFDNIAGLAFGPAAVPEPGTLALLALGVAGLGAVRRRRP